MKKLQYLVFAFLIGVSLASCSSDSQGAKSNTGPEFSTSDLQGNWTATEILFSYSEVNDVPVPDHADIGQPHGSQFIRQDASQFQLAG